MRSATVLPLPSMVRFESPDGRSVTIRLKNLVIVQLENGNFIMTGFDYDIYTEKKTGYRLVSLRDVSSGS